MYKDWDLSLPIMVDGAKALPGDGEDILQLIFDRAGLDLEAVMPDESKRKAYAHRVMRLVPDLGKPNQ